MVAPEVNRVTPLQVVESQRGDRDALGLQVQQGRLQSRQIGGVGRSVSRLNSAAP